MYKGNLKNVKFNVYKDRAIHTVGIGFICKDTVDSYREHYKQLEREFPASEGYSITESDCKTIEPP